MADTRKLTLKIVGDAKSALGALGQMGDASDSFGSKLKGLGKKSGVAFLAIGTGAAVLAKSFVNAASNMEESLAKVNVVFGDNASEVIKFSKTAATAMGLSSQQALEAAGTYGNLFQAFGLSRDAATGMSTNLVQLASDLASFNNVPIDDALLALRSGLSGETEPLKKFGVALNDARLKEQAMSMGIYKGTGTLDAGQKAQAAYALILKDTSLAQGDYARTADGVANRQRTIAAQFTDIKTGIGTALLPAFGAILGLLSNKIIPVFQEFGDVAGEKGLGAAISMMANKVKENAPKLLTAVTEALQRTLDWVITTGVPSATEALSKMGVAFVNWIGPRIGPMLMKLQELYYALQGWVFNTLVPRLTDILIKAGTVLSGWIVKAIPPLIKGLQEFAQKLGDFIANTALPRLLENVKKLGNALVEWVGPVLRELPAKLIELTGTIVGVLVSKVIPAILKATPGLLWAMTKWIGSLAGDLIIGLGKAFVALLKAIPQLALELGKGFLSLGASLMANLGNGIMGIAEWVKDKLIGFVNGLIDKFNSIPVVPNIDKIKTDTNKAAEAMTGLSSAMSTLPSDFNRVSADAKTLAAAQGTLSTQTNTTNTDLSDLSGTLAGGGGGGGGGKKAAKKSVKQSLGEAQDAFKTFTGALQSVGSAQKDVTNSIKGTITAQNNLTSATQAVSKAQAALDQIARGYGVGSKQATTAQEELEQAQRNQTRAGYAVEQATFAITEAEKTLAVAREGEDKVAIREAEISLAEAKMTLTERILDEKQAITDTATAQGLLNEATNGATTGSKTYTDALTVLQDAQKTAREAVDLLADAKERETESTWKLVDAEKALMELRGKTLTPTAEKAIEQFKERGGELSAGAGAALESVQKSPADFLKMVNKQFSANYKTVAEYVKAGKGKKSETARRERFKNYMAAGSNTGGQASGMSLDFSQIDLSGITAFAKGGVVTRPMVGMLGEAGREAVIPLDRINTGGDTYNITINSKIADTGLPDLIVAELRKFNRRSGAIDIQVA